MIFGWGWIYFHSTLLIRYFVVTAKSCGILGIRWLTILLSSPALYLPFYSFLQHRFYPCCLLNWPLNRTNLISCQPSLLCIKAANILGVQYPFGLDLDCLALFLDCNCLALFLCLGAMNCTILYTHFRTLG